MTKLDAICFETQSSNVILTHNQKYIFNSVMSIFRKEIAENYFSILVYIFLNIVIEDRLFIR